MTNTTNYSRSAGTNRTITVTVVDPTTGPFLNELRDFQRRTKRTEYELDAAVRQRAQEIHSKYSTAGGATQRLAQIHQLKPVKSGVLAKLVGSNFNVFRPYNESVWYENVTSSTRFNLETEGMTQNEVVAFMNEQKAAASTAPNSAFDEPIGRRQK